MNAKPNSMLAKPLDDQVKIITLQKHYERFQNRDSVLLRVEHLYMNKANSSKFYFYNLAID